MVHIMRILIGRWISVPEAHFSHFLPQTFLVEALVPYHPPLMKKKKEMETIPRTTHQEKSCWTTTSFFAHGEKFPNLLECETAEGEDFDHSKSSVSLP